MRAPKLLGQLGGITRLRKTLAPNTSAHSARLLQESSPAEVRLRYFPDYSHSNSYTDLLYREFPSGWEIGPGPISDTIDLCETFPDAAVVFHLH